jgi:hypothetical protein
MMHTGISRDGSLLYPAMPFASYTKVTRADSDAIFAYLMSVPPVRQANRKHELRFPFNNRGSDRLAHPLFQGSEFVTTRSSRRNGTVAPTSSRARPLRDVPTAINALGDEGVAEFSDDPEPELVRARR